MLTSVLAVFLEELLDLFASLAIGNLNIILGGTIVGHEGEKVVIGDVKLKIVCQCWCLWTYPDASSSPVGIPGDGHWVRPCCG